MSDLIWTCADGSLFMAEIDGLELMICPAPTGSGFRYQLFRPASATWPRSALASGHRNDLRETIGVAERIARTFVPGAAAWTRPRLAQSESAPAGTGSGHGATRQMEPAGAWSRSARRA